MRTVQVSYNQKGVQWLDDINVPDEIAIKSVYGYLYNTLYRRHGKVENFEINQWY